MKLSPTQTKALAWVAAGRPLTIKLPSGVSLDSLSAAGVIELDPLWRWGQPGPWKRKTTDSDRNPGGSHRLAGETGALPVDLP